MNVNQQKSRRRFLSRSVLACGLALCPVEPLGRKAIAQEDDEDRFQMSLHQYSLKPLFDSGKLNLRNYAEFAKTTLEISNIEFGAEFCGDLFASPEKCDAIREHSKQIGVAHRILLCADGDALDAIAAEQRSNAIDVHMKWAKVAERLGCEHIRVRACTEGDPKQQLSHAAEGIGGLCDALMSSPVSVLIENIAGFSRDPDWLVDLVKKIGTDRVGLVADFGNFDGDIYAGMKRILPYVESICTKSWEFDAEGNETKIDFARMMGVIKDSDYRGRVAIEYLGTEPVSGIQKTVALVRKSLKAKPV